MKLIVRNFGPINNVEIDIKPFNIFIGPQASGKSVLAKLHSIFNDKEFILSIDLPKFLSIYNIDFLKDNTFIEFQHNDTYFRYSEGKLETNSTLKDEVNINESINYLAEIKKIDKDILSKTLEELKEKGGSEAYIDFLSLIINEDDNHYTKKTQLNFWDNFLPHVYIPTERVVVASISDFLFNFIQSGIDLPECVINFGARFENARKKLSHYTIPFLDGVEYSYENSQNKLKISADQTINFTQSSSGMQAVIPMAILIDYFSSKEQTNFVIEEPELNLYPTTQKRLVEFISSKCLHNGNNLTVTTHSPYILTSFANLIQAHNVAQISKEAKKEVAEIIPEDYWIDFDNVSTYYIDNGTAVDILDYENKTIDANTIDDVSETIAKEFEALLNIKYRE
jgi:hypothetical protein